jgi:outer membrane protein assembly factor BamB
VHPSLSRFSRINRSPYLRSSRNQNTKLNPNEGQEDIFMKHVLSILRHGAALCILASCIALLHCSKKHPTQPNPNQQGTFTLKTEVEEGVQGWPEAGTRNWLEGDTVRYRYELAPGATNLSVSLDGQAVPDSGFFTMTKDRLLTATCINRLLWHLDFDKALYYCIPAVARDGTVYVTTGILWFSEYGSVYAVSPDGRILWSFDLEKNAYSPVVGPDGTVYVQDFMNTIYALSPSGSLKWNYRDYDNDLIHYDMGQRNPAIGADGTVYIVADGLYAVDPSNGKRLWRFNPYNKWCRQSPVIGADGTIYLTIHQDQFFAVNPDGTLKWESRFDHEEEMTFGTPAIDSDGTLYIGSEVYQLGSNLYAFNPDGSLKWKAAAVNSAPLRASPAIGPDGTIYAAGKCGPDRNAVLMAFDPAGTKKWEYSVGSIHVTGDDIYSSPSIGADGLIYFGAETGYLYALNPEGTLAWKCELEFGINWSSPVILSDGTLLIGTITGAGYQGHLYALRTSSLGYADSPWPRYRGNDRNTGLFGDL